MNNQDQTKTEGGVSNIAFLDCVASLERVMLDAENNMEEAVARGAYGEAEYHKGRSHAYVLASLRVKRMVTNANESSSSTGREQP